MAKNYHIGLDIGTSSVGWAVMDDDFQIMRVKGKKAIGVRLFKEGQTAAKRRGFRTTRRRYNRRKWRLKLLEEIFDSHLTPVDETFFARMKESNLSPLDSNKQFSGNLFFPEKSKLEIRQWTAKYPTIYHLRYALMTEHRQFDIREIFLAMHHIVKYRGNFLRDGNLESSDKGLSDILSEIDELYDEIGFKFRLGDDNYKYIEEILFDKSLTKSDKISKLKKRIINDKGIKELVNIVYGEQAEFKQVIVLDGETDEKLAESDIKTKFKISDDEKFTKLYDAVDDYNQSILNSLKALYFELTYRNLIGNHDTFSSAMIEKYNQHKIHLRLIKAVLKYDLSEDEYDSFINQCLNNPAPFMKLNKRHDQSKWDSFVNLYHKYTHGGLKNGETELYTSTKKFVDGKLLTLLDEWYEEDRFMPKLRTISNASIPHQLHQNELDKIIENQSEFYPWLADPNRNEERRSVAKYKLSELVAFRIPYYVGPLVSSEQSKFAWMIRKTGMENQRITPWYFDEIVDRDASAENFIKRMTTKDTYLVGEDVLPANSLIYQKYKLLDELNRISVNGSKLTCDQKKIIIDKVFKKKKSVSIEDLKNVLISEYPIPFDVEIKGLSDSNKFNSSLSSYIKFERIVKNAIDDPNKQDDIEQMIEWSTIFEDKEIFNEKLKKIDWITSEQRNQITQIRLRGWGRLSRKLLTKISDKNGNNIINLLETTPNTFNSIVSQQVIATQIDKLNRTNLTTGLDDTLDSAYTSPQNKKAIRQVLLVVDDIQKAMKGQEPTSISIEFAKGEDGHRRTITRKQKVEQLYKELTRDIVSDEVKHRLSDTEKLSEEKLYLYFLQAGKDLYTGKPINIDNLNDYDVDHIIPRTKIKDDSIDNKVLTIHEFNVAKSNNLDYLRDNCSNLKSLWFKMADNKLISGKKLSHLLMDSEKFKKREELFVNRQLVETRQVTKLVAQILNNKFNETKIISVKASLTTELRNKLNLYKNRNVNDYHHAMDAYITVFIGFYLYQRYPKMRRFFTYGEFQKFDIDINILTFLSDLTKSNNNQRKIVTDDGEIVGDRLEMIRNLRSVYQYKYMLVSRETYRKTGELYDRTIYSHDSGKKLIPLKKDKQTDIYGGYSSNKDAYLAIVKLPSKGKKPATYKVVGVPARFAPQLERVKEDHPDEYLSFLKEVLTSQFTKDKKNRKTGEITKVVDKFEIILPEVNYRQLVIDDENWFMLGSSTYKYNARQLVLSDYAMKLLSEKGRKDANLSAEELGLQLNEVFDEIISVMNQRFGLYDKNSFRFKINENVNKFYELPIKAKFEGNKKISDGKLDVLESLLSGLHANASFGDLKPLGLKTPFGFMQYSSGIKLISDSILIFQSPTGLFERRVRLGDIKPK